MNKAAAGSAKQKRPMSDAHLHQISVLRAMWYRDTTNSSRPECKPLLITEIILRSGLSDEKDVQRALYILEGQKLVSPHPEGDFTSKTWLLTSDGLKALHLISQESLGVAA